MRESAAKQASDLLAWYAAMGTDHSKGTKVFSLCGKITNTGLVEVPMGISLREIVFDIGGGRADLGFRGGGAGRGQPDAAAERCAGSGARLHIDLGNVSDGTVLDCNYRIFARAGGLFRRGAPDQCQRARHCERQNKRGCFHLQVPFRSCSIWWRRMRPGGATMWRFHSAGRV